MQTFPLVTPLLQALDQQGRAQYGDEWDNEVNRAILDLRERYKDLRNSKRKLIDYSSLPVQMAYCFIYAGANANCLFQILSLAQNHLDGPLLDTAIPKRREIRITSWGGGPGSDLLALVALLRQSPPDQRPKKIQYRVLDKQPNWHEILKKVAELQQGTVEIDVSFEQVDVTVPEQWRQVSNAEDHILIMNFFVSEVCSLKLAQSVRDCLTASLNSLPKGSMLVYNDSNFPSAYKYFDNLSDKIRGFKKLISENREIIVNRDFDEYYWQCMERFDNILPKLKSNAAYRVLRKK